MILKIINGHLFGGNDLDIYELTHDLSQDARGRLDYIMSKLLRLRPDPAKYDLGTVGFRTVLIHLAESGYLDAFEVKAFRDAKRSLVKLRQGDLAKHFGVTRMTIYRDILPLVRRGFVAPSKRGYLPTAKFFRFFRWIADNAPDYAKLWGGAR